MGTILQEYDAKLMLKAGSLIGLDEVGRGALAGPVFTAACLLKEDFFLNKENLNITTDFRDSKKMSAKLREQAFESLSHLKATGSIDFEITTASFKRLSHSIFLEQLACHWTPLKAIRKKRITCKVLFLSMKLLQGFP